MFTKVREINYPGYSRVVGLRVGEDQEYQALSRRAHEKQEAGICERNDE
jgi:hypothetical protein